MSEKGPRADHPHTDPGDGRTECKGCGKYVWPATHSCKGVPVTARARARRGGEVKRSDLSTRYVLFVVDHVGVNAWDHLSAAVPPKVALAAIQREVDAGNLDYGVWLGRPFLTPQGRAKLAEAVAEAHGATYAVPRVFIAGSACCGGNGAEASCEVCRHD